MEDKVNQNQLDIAVLKTSLEAHLDACSNSQNRVEKMLSVLFDRVTRLERVVWIGLGFVIALQLVLTLAKFFLFDWGSPGGEL